MIVSQIRVDNDDVIASVRLLIVLLAARAGKCADTLRLFAQ
jgi:hypothetical protein